MPIKQARCPRCGEPASLEKTNRFRPFCSERCKLLDLGEWMTGRYSIAVAQADSGEDTPAPDAQSRERLQ